MEKGKNYKIIIFLILAVIICPYLLFSQSLPVSSGYIINKYTLSPACAGLHNNFKATMAYRQNWTGLRGAPENTMIYLDGAIFDNTGYGLILATEKYGIFKDLNIGGTYAYHLLFNKNQYLSFGLTAEYYRNEIDFGNIKIYDKSDFIVNQHQYAAASSFNACIGMSYVNREFNAGITINNLFKNKLDNNEVIYTPQRQFKGYLSYNYKIKRFNYVEPVLVIYKISNTGINYEFAGIYKYADSFWTGLIYRNGLNISLLAGLNLYGSFLINYTYEINPGTMLGKSLNSHEVSIGFLVDKDQRFSIEYIKAKRRHFINTVRKIFKRQ